MSSDPIADRYAASTGLVIGSQRRYYLFAYWSARAMRMGALALTLKGQHAALAGTPIDPGFPAYAALQAAQYLCVEDLTGCDGRELIRHGLRYGDAIAVLEALGLPTIF